MEVYSESENLFLEFKSVDAPYAEHRGFEIEYTFSRNFVDLGKDDKKSCSKSDDSWNLQEIGRSADLAENLSTSCSCTLAILTLGKMKGKDNRINHIRGTECDIHVVSNGESEHLIRSPNFPGDYPPNKMCTYILDGMQGPQKLEQVSLEFQTFDVLATYPK